MLARWQGVEGLLTLIEAIHPELLLKHPASLIAWDAQGEGSTEAWSSLWKGRQCILSPICVKRQYQSYDVRPRHGKKHTTRFHKEGKEGKRKGKGVGK